MTTQQLIDYCTKLIAGGNVNTHFTHKGKYPQHLRWEVNRIKHLYDETGFISEHDTDFLTTMYNSDTKWLMDHAYILGEWWSWRSHTHKNYNLRRYGSKYVKKVKGFATLR